MSDLSQARVGRWDRKERTHCKFGHLYDGSNTGWKLNRKGYLCRECKECSKLRMRRKREKPDFLEREAAAMRQWRAANPERDRQNWIANRRAKKEWLDSLKVKCGKCGETHVACLEFHHRNPAEKDFLLSVGVAKYTLARLQAEVDKCDVICANCHRKLHYDERVRERE